MRRDVPLALRHEHHLEASSSGAAAIRAARWITASSAGSPVTIAITRSVVSHTWLAVCSRRYSRQVLLGLVGDEAQRELRAARRGSAS